MRPNVIYSTTEVETLDERLQRVIACHFHPAEGSAFWLDRAEQLGLAPMRDIRSIDDLHLLGENKQQDLRQRPLIDYIPRRFHSRLDRFIVGQTGGSTGEGVWTAYREDEFEEAFVYPFTVAASHVGFPSGGAWLYIGPSGPHIIGKVVRHLANSLGSGDPFSIDFDPRWIKKLPPASIAHDRYVCHVIDQALAVLQAQPIDVLFTTPAVLETLVERMTEEQRMRIRGVHYGGMALTSEQMHAFQAEAFPHAIHLSGYGNTLFGCCLELNVRPGRELDYYPMESRLILEVVDDEGQPLPAGHPGRVRFTRLDESMLIVRMVERDEATLVGVPEHAPTSYSMSGVRHPHVPAGGSQNVAVGLY